MRPGGEFARVKQRALILFLAATISAFYPLKDLDAEVRQTVISSFSDWPYRVGYRAGNGFLCHYRNLGRNRGKPASPSRHLSRAPRAAGMGCARGTTSLSGYPIESPGAWSYQWCRSDPYRWFYPLSGKSRSATDPSHDCPKPSTWNRERRRIRRPEVRRARVRRPRRCCGASRPRTTHRPWLTTPYTAGNFDRQWTATVKPPGHGRPCPCDSKSTGSTSSRSCPTQRSLAATARESRSNIRRPLGLPGPSDRYR